MTTKGNKDKKRAPLCMGMLFAKNKIRAKEGAFCYVDGIHCSFILSFAGLEL